MQLTRTVPATADLLLTVACVHAALLLDCSATLLLGAARVCDDVGRFKANRSDRYQQLAGAADLCTTA